MRKTLFPAAALVGFLGAASAFSAQAASAGEAAVALPAAALGLAGSVDRLAFESRLGTVAAEVRFRATGSRLTGTAAIDPARLTPPNGGLHHDGFVAGAPGKAAFRVLGKAPAMNDDG